MKQEAAETLKQVMKVAREANADKEYREPDFLMGFVRGAWWASQVVKPIFDAAKLKG